MEIGYARVSTKDQSLDLQVDALRRAGCAKVYQEVVSGAKVQRPVLDTLLGELRPGDVLVIWKLDRLGRSLRHLVELAGDADGAARSGCKQPQRSDRHHHLPGPAGLQSVRLAGRVRTGSRSASAPRPGWSRPVPAVAWADGPRACRRRPSAPPAPPRPSIASSACRCARSPTSSASPRAPSTPTCATAGCRSAAAAVRSRRRPRRPSGGHHGATQAASRRSPASISAGAWRHWPHAAPSGGR